MNGEMERMNGEIGGTGIESALRRVQLNGWLVNKLEKESAETCDGRPGDASLFTGHRNCDKFGKWRREWCQLRGKRLNFFSSRESVEKGEEMGPESTLGFKRVRAWEEKYGKAYDKGFLVDVEEGGVLVARYVCGIHALCAA